MKTILSKIWINSSNPEYFKLYSINKKYETTNKS